MGGGTFSRIEETLKYFSIIFQKNNPNYFSGDNQPKPLSTTPQTPLSRHWNNQQTTNNPSSPSQKTPCSTFCSTNQLPKQQKICFQFHSQNTPLHFSLFSPLTNEPLTLASSKARVYTMNPLMANNTLINGSSLHIQ